LHSFPTRRSSDLVPKQKRYLPLLAGILIDLLLTSILILLVLAIFVKIFVLPILYVRIMRAIAITCLLRIAWQFFLYIRTDLYYVIANVFNCKNLLNDTEVFLYNHLARFIKSIHPQDQSRIPSSERHVIRVYAVIWIVGRLLSIITLFGVSIPILSRYARNIRDVLKIG